MLSVWGWRKPPLLPLPATTPLPTALQTAAAPSRGCGLGGLCALCPCTQLPAAPLVGGWWGAAPPARPCRGAGPRAGLWLPARLGNSFLPKSVCRRCPSTVKRLSQTHTLRLGCLRCSHGAFSAFNKHFSASARCLGACGCAQRGAAGPGRWRAAWSPAPGPDSARWSSQGKALPRISPPLSLAFSRRRQQ